MVLPAARIAELGYSRRHAQIGREMPYKPIVQGDSDREKAEIEFIAEKSSPETLQQLSSD